MGFFVKVQRGFTDVPLDGATVTLDESVSSLSNAFVVNTNNRRQSAGQDGSGDDLEIRDISGGITLTDESTLTFYRDSNATVATGSTRFHWEVWEYTGAQGEGTEFKVIGSYEVDLDGINSTSVSISGVTNKDKCIPFISGIMNTSGGDDADLATAIAWLSDSSTLNIRRGGDELLTKVWVTVVEFIGDDWDIKHGRLESSNDSGVITLVDNSDGETSGGGDVGNWEKTLIHHQFKANDRNGVDDSIADTSALYYPGDNTSEVKYNFHSDHVDSASDGQKNVHFVHTITHPKISVFRYTDTTSHTGAYNIDISGCDLVDISRATVEITRTTSGTGTAYGRGWVSARLVDESTLEMYVHRNKNTIETRIQVVDLSGLIDISIDDTTKNIIFKVDEKKIYGYGFKETQGSGKVEVSTSSDYSTGTKVEQTVISWSENEIEVEYDLSQFEEGTLYLFVTNDNGSVSSRFKIIYTEDEYGLKIKGLKPDIYYRFNNSYKDEMGVVDADSNEISGNVSFKQNPITRGVDYSWSIDDKDSRVSPENTVYVNKVERLRRTLGGWIYLDKVYKTPSIIYEEGGTVNNLYFVVGFGNSILANMADSDNGVKIQGYSDFKLSSHRPYFIVMRLETGGGLFELFVDGKKVKNYAGLDPDIPNKISPSDFSGHIGEITYGGKPEGKLDTGGTDIQYPGATLTGLNDWFTFSDLSLNGGLLTDEEIFDLFVSGAIPTDVIETDTNENMQNSADNLSGKSYEDVPLPIKVKPRTDGDITTISLSNISFDERCSVHLSWLGDESRKLIIKAEDGTNIDLSKCVSPNGGEIEIFRDTKLVVSGMVDGSSVTVIDSNTKEIIDSDNYTTEGEVSFWINSNLVDIFVVADDKKIVQKFNIDTTTDTRAQIVQDNDYAYENEGGHSNITGSDGNEVRTSDDSDLIIQ